MKKLISVFLVTLMLCSVTAAVAEELPAIVTVKEWLETEGAVTGLVIAQVQEIINPMLAVIADETGRVNLFAVTVNGEITDFFTAGISAGDLILLWNPQYNVFEGSVEMADAVLLRHAVLGGGQ